MSGSLTRVNWDSWAPLAAILGLQVAVAELSLHNTAFQDEGLYVYAGRQIFEQWLGVPVVQVPWASTMSGVAYLYPLLAGIVDTFFGFGAVRLLSLVWMLLATLVVYEVAKSLFDREAGLFAAAAFVTQGPVLFLSHLATYDAMTVGLLATALLLTLRMAKRPGVGSASALGLILFLAFMTKYAGLLFVPSVLALLGWQLWRGRSLRAAVGYVSLAFGAFAVCTALTLYALPDVRSSLLGSTLQRVIVAPASREELLGMVIETVGPLICLALLGLALGFRKDPILAMLLFGSLLLPSAYHIYKEEQISLYKHLAYGAMFGAPLAGYGLARLNRYVQRAGVGPLRDAPWIVGLSVCLLLFGAGLQQATAQYESWPDSAPLISVLRTQIHPGSRILAEESEVPRFYLQDITQVWQWNGLYWFQYRDKAGQVLSEDAAYRAAIDDGYFDIVELRFGYSLDRAHLIEAELQKSQQYRVLTRIPFTTSIGTGQYTIWVKVNKPTSP